MGISLRVELNKADMTLAEQQYVQFINKLSTKYKLEVRIDKSSMDNWAKTQKSVIDNVEKQTNESAKKMTTSIKNYQEKASMDLDKLKEKHAGVWNSPQAQASINKFKQNLGTLTSSNQLGGLTNQMRGLRTELEGLSNKNNSAFFNDMGNAFSKFPKQKWGIVV